MARLPALNRFPALRTLALAAVASLPLGGCYYYGDAPMGSYAYADGACETRYGDDYYARDPYAYDDGYGYDCYDSADYRGGFVQIGFGGGWYDDFYYPGYGTWLFDTYGQRYPLRDRYLNYWGGRRAWYKHHGHRGGQYGGGHWQGGGGRGDHHGGDGRGGHPGGGRGDGWNGSRPPRGDDAAPQPSRDRGGVFQQILDPRPGSAPQRPPRGDRRPPAGYAPAQPVAGNGDVSPAPARPRWGDRTAPPPVSAAPRPDRSWQPPAQRVSAPPPPSASAPERSYSPPQRSYSAPPERSAPPAPRSAPPAPRSEPAQRAPTPSRDQTGPVRDD